MYAHTFIPVHAVALRKPRSPDTSPRSSWNFRGPGHGNLWQYSRPTLLHATSCQPGAGFLGASCFATAPDMFRRRKGPGDLGSRLFILGLAGKATVC